MDKLIRIWEEKEQTLTSVVKCEQYCPEEQASCYCRNMMEVRVRLAAYEDTDLMPEDVMSLKQELDVIKAGRDRAVAHLTRLCQYIEPVECGGGGFYCHMWDRACDNCRYVWERKEEE